MVDHARATLMLRRFAGTLAHEYDLRDVLEQLGKDIAATLGCAGAGVMLADTDEDLHFVSTSDEVLGTLEQLQIELDEGPCLLAYRTGEPVVASDLADDERFPTFGPRAVGVGMRAVYSFPMRLRETPIGALNLYDAAAGDMSDEALEVGQAIADVATIYVSHARDLAEHEELTAGLQRALDSRVIVEQAKGFLSAHWEIEPQAAFEVLRRHSRSNSIKVHAVAEDILSGKVLPDQLGHRSDRR